ncbi:hypothetical protein [Cypionkella psychrotolerans]|uniref:hypothetical protein n=1 Tax=Cypionkella psychrotolerans TaxID=1678131 RepID=UPI000A99D285|nr:hypothetical protein [Cypionkella psychrotolerans]
MNEIIQPEWMQGYVPSHGPGDGSPGNPSWKRGGPSPNPAGRPKGIIDKRQKLHNAFADEAVSIAKVVIDKALEGDMQAANIALARIAPPLRAQAERVQFELSDDVPLSAQARQILQAVADGKLDADTAKMLVGCIQSVAGIRAVEDLESRLAILEAKAV